MVRSAGRIEVGIDGCSIIGACMDLCLNDKKKHQHTCRRK